MSIPQESYNAPIRPDFTEDIRNAFHVVNEHYIKWIEFNMINEITNQKNGGKQSNSQTEDVDMALEHRALRGYMRIYQSSCPNQFHIMEAAPRIFQPKETCNRQTTSSL